MNFFFSSRRRHTFFFQAEDGIRDRSPSRGLGDVYKRQMMGSYLCRKTESPGPSSESIYVTLFTPVLSHTSGRGASTGHSTSLRQHATSTCLDSRAMGSVFSICKASGWSIIAPPTVACTSQLRLWPLLSLIHI